MLTKCQPREKITTKFFMGNYKHHTEEVTVLKIQDKKHTFIIVPHDFPLPEDRIIGVPFLYSYKFNLSNNTLQLDNKIHALVSVGIIIPKNSIKIIKIPDSIYRIYDSQIIVPISNETENEVRLSDNDIKFKFISSLPERIELVNYITKNELSTRLKLLKESLRFDHIKEAHKTVIEKITMSYHDIFTLPSDPLPCTNLDFHKILLKDGQIINLQKARHPE